MVGGGSVSPDEFARMACLFGMTDKRQIDEMLIISDSDGDGEIDFIEFVGMMTSNAAGGTTELRGHLTGFREVMSTIYATSMHAACGESVP